mmetsp:Transcript_23063/g.53937  ORF Transcript_23063/g.53937 Transcript_23063/m.53937 type:complete len:124 (-) Transcript_23063:261-632(-)
MQAQSSFSWDKVDECYGQDQTMTSLKHLKNRPGNLMLEQHVLLAQGREGTKEDRFPSLDFEPFEVYSPEAAQPCAFCNLETGELDSTALKNLESGRCKPCIRCGLASKSAGQSEIEAGAWWMK